MSGKGWTAAVVAAAVLLTGCDPDAVDTTPSDGDTDPGSGFVITPKGGIAPDLGGGLYIDHNGNVGIGFPI